MSSIAQDLAIVPIVLPLVAAAILLLLGDRRRRLRSFVHITATVAGLGVALALVRAADAGQVIVYLASNWEAPFGIVLVVDRLSAMMLLLVGLLSTGAAIYGEAGWSRAGAYFQPLFQIQLLGLNGAFLTGDLFNLFVFFEVLLAASYGLQLHGSGWPRVRSGMHYLAVNLLASLMFLIGLAILYGIVGTLNMADIAQKLAAVPAHDRGLLHVGTAILAVAFLVKAAMWPLNAWLIPAYAAAAAPSAALFVLMTKVGVYVVLRLWTLLFSADAGVSAYFGSEVLVAGGLASLGFGVLALLSAIRLERVAAASVLVSSGTLLTALGMHSVSLGAAALYYLASATLAGGALFLLVELAKRTSVEGGAQQTLVDDVVDEDDNLDDQQLPLVGRAVPVPVAMLGLAFIACALLVAGLPPLSGFIAKLALLRAVVDSAAAAPVASWTLVALLLLSSLFATLTLTRAGIRHFWSKGGRFAPRVEATESVAVVFLLGACVLLTLFAEPALRYTATTAASLHEPRVYVDAVLGARARPSPSDAVPAGDP